MPKNIPVSLPDTTTKLPAREPILGRAVPSFPTPVINDKIYTEFVSTEQGDYQAYPYGTLYDSVNHGPFQQSRPDFELVWQGPADTNGFAVKRIWVNNRVSQNSYNYSITFEDEDPAFPEITRLYVYPRDKYDTGQPDQVGPLDPLTPDEQFPQALLVQEKMLNQTDPPEINSKFITVARVYKTLPGPQVLSADFDSSVNAQVNSVRQMVLSSDTFDPTSVTNLLQCQESPQSKYFKLRAYSYFPTLPATREEYKTGKYPFPTLVTDITTSVVSLDTVPTNRSFVEWYPTMKDDPNAAALYKVTTQFFNAEPSPDTIYVFNTQNLVYKGISFQIAINSVLNDGITMSASFTGDPNYGDLSESITFDATTPSATEYLALIGSYVIVGSDITQWRGNVWTKVTTRLLLI